MSYAVVIGPDAGAVLSTLLPEIVECVRGALDRLAADPVGLSRRAAPPLVFRGQVFRFACDHAATRYYFLVLFKYAPDEQTLHIESIDVSKLT